MTTNENWRERIVCDPNLHHGEPCIRGTRVAVSVIVANLTELTIEQILDGYPQLARDDVNAAILHAAEASHNTLVA